MSASDPFAPPDMPAGKWVFSAPMKYVAVVSHDCEFNEGKRDRLLVARMSSVDKRWDEERLESLRQSNDVEARHEAGEEVNSVDSFLLEAIPDEFESCHLALFSTLTPFSMSLAKSLHLAKKAELDHQQRLLFRRKLAWYFMRNPDDVPDDEKRAPEDVLSNVNYDP